VSVGDIRAFESADRLAVYAGLVPAARDSGKRVGNHRSMRGGNKVLKRLFYQSAFASLRNAPESTAFYDRKRAEGKRHTQALVALARRRVIGGGVVIGEAEFPAPLDDGVVGVLAYDEHQGVLHAAPLPDGRYESLHPRCSHPPG
jgi:hypothetical protein